MMLHLCVTRVAAPHARALQDLARICHLLQADAVAPLFHFDAKIETE
jgi:hypothetical protein